MNGILLLACLLFSPAERLETGLREKLAGKTDEAVRIWQEVWETQPDSPFGADALFLTGEALEEAGRYGEAMDYYRRVAKAHPSHRKTPKARQRLAYLALARAGGDEPLRRYEEILREYHRMESAEAVRRMENLISVFPGFPLRGRAMMWVADRHLEAGRHEEAIRWFRALLVEYPAAQEAVNAVEGIGLALQQSHRYDEAEAVFRGMENFGGAARARAEFMVARSKAHEFRHNLLFKVVLPFQVACLAVIVLGMRWHRLRWSHLCSALKEAAFVAPLLLGLYLVLARRDFLAARAAGYLFLSVPPVLVLNALYLQVGSLWKPLRWLYPVLATLFVGGLIYATFCALDLVFILEQIGRGDVGDR